MRERSALVGVLAAVACGIAAAPSGATLVCQPGTTNPNYCTDYGPTAITQSATGVRGASANLNGITGPTIANGDVTSYFFGYGRTSAYGYSSGSGQVGSCPPGKSGIAYCSSPATRFVTVRVRGLLPCTKYHFRIFARNRDGSAVGSDKEFRTRFETPIRWVRSPHNVFRSQARYFGVTLKLVTPAHLSLVLVRRIHRRHTVIVQTVDSRHFERLQSGKVHVTFASPAGAGSYTVNTTARLSCGSEAINKPLRVV